MYEDASETTSYDDIVKALGGDLSKIQEAMDNTTGAAQAMADTQLDNLSGDITLFQSALEGAKIAVSDGLTPTLREFVQFGGEGLGSLTEAFKEGGLTGAMDELGNLLSEFLAMIIEKITGMEFDRYLQQNVFDPCGMTQSGYFELDRLPGNCAVNYVYCNNLNDFRTNIFCVDAKGTGAGGAFVTVKDIVRFWSALTEGRIISGNMFKTMISRQSGDGSDAEEGYYGFGMWIIDGKGQKDIPYFQGCDPGVSFISEYNPNTNTVSVFVSNYCDNVWAIARKLRQR